MENVVATASNMHTGTIFWSDMKLKKISRLDKSSEPKDVRGITIVRDASGGDINFGVVAFRRLLRPDWTWWKGWPTTGSGGTFIGWILD